MECFNEREHSKAQTTFSSMEVRAEDKFGEAAKQRAQTVGHCLPAHGETKPWLIQSLFAAIPSWAGVRLGDLQEPRLLLTRVIWQVTLGQVYVHMLL